MSVLIQRISEASRRNSDTVVENIKNLLEHDVETLAQRIRKKNLYFRISVIGNCNLSCTFCHNEGGPNKGRITSTTAIDYIQAAKEIGYNRVQFTGGEPLLHPKIADFVAIARNIVDDVGLTTNGTLLEQRSNQLLQAGISRIHVSLQSEALQHPTEEKWQLPDEIFAAASKLAEGGVQIRFNVPVERRFLPQARDFFFSARNMPWTFNIFAILASANEHNDNPEAYLSDLKKLAEDSNRGLQNNHAQKVQIRGYSKPIGIRCSACSEKYRCTEQSRSLRLGVDETLRPCLATRDWDIPPDGRSIVERVRIASYLAVDW